MNWSEFAAVAAGIGSVVMVMGVVFVSGKLARQVGEHSERLDGHGEILDAHGISLGVHDSKIARLEGWKEGYSAGAKYESEQHKR